MNIKLKNDIPVCQRARRLSCSEKLQVNNQIDDWLRQVNIDGLCCSEGSLSLGSGNEGKREIVLNRRPELYRGKYRCVQPKINLLKRRSYACETQCFPVEHSGCRRGAFT
ncbi:hypothetical protein TNCV_3139081 [Trichonephila clavipes]|nr:hypothetical protein TNCV_3139081 [Trichonephila clavipes]